MEELDQECIICTLNLVVASTCGRDAIAVVGERAAIHEIPTSSHPCTINQMKAVAVIKPCNHYLHNHCLREWAQIANTCPFCRQSFNLVEVLDAVGVQDKKQVANDSGTLSQELDEEEDTDPCPICNESNNPEILVLCDACDANYHTYCLGLEDVPQGEWFCMECVCTGAYNQVEELGVSTRSEPISRRRAPRTQATVRRTRQRLRNDNWLGPWSQIGHRIHGATGLDIDFSEDEDVTSWRRLHQNSTRHETQNNLWQQRLNIARRQGADWALRSMSPILPRAPTPVESVEESMAWGDFEKAKEIDTTSPLTRKRKPRLIASSSSASSASNSQPQLERKLKRPRTRRVLDQPESSSVLTNTHPQAREFLQRAPPPDAVSPDANDEPSFLSSLLREVDMASRSEDGRPRSTFAAQTPSTTVTSPSEHYSSPIISPALSSYNSTRPTARAASSNMKSRSMSPLPLTSRIEPVFSPAEFSLNHSKSLSMQEASMNSSIELHSPRPLGRSTSTQYSSKSKASVCEGSPSIAVSQVRATMSSETKRDISKIVKSALAPHWKSSNITKEQYGCINRDVSRKLYEILANNDLDEVQRYRCNKIATAEVATAVKSLSASL